MSLQWSRLVGRFVAAIGLVLLSPSAFAQLRPEPDAVNLAPPEVIDRLRADPIAYFRFVNRPWIARVCDMFADDIRDRCDTRGEHDTAALRRPGAERGPMHLRLRPVPALAA